MTYQEVKKQVLRLLNQYKIAGSEVADTYNNQADYIDRIPGLINDALMELGTTVRKQEVTADLSQVNWLKKDLGNSYSYTMPEDFFAFKSGENWLLINGRPVSNQLYTEKGLVSSPPGAVARSSPAHTLTLPKALVDNNSVMVTYYIYPPLLDDDPSDSTIVYAAPDVLRAIPYYAAGMLALHDDPFLASSLMNAYEDKLAKMAPIPTTEIAPVMDAYGLYWANGRDYV